MLSICKAYFWLQKRFQGNPYFEQTLRMLRFTVIGLVASAALLLMKPVCSKTTGKSKYALMEDKWIFIFKCVSIANIRKLFIICNK